MIRLITLATRSSPSSDEAHSLALFSRARGLSIYKVGVTNIAA